MFSLLDRNQVFLRQQRQRLGSAAVLLSSERVVDEQGDNKERVAGDQSFEDWLACKHRALLHPQMFPSVKGVENFKRTLLGLSSDGGVAQYKGKTEADPHVMWGLMKLRQLETEIGADPDQQASQMNFKPSLLLTLGTGDGVLLKQMVEMLQPYHLCIALRSWADLESSFDAIDWCEWWNQRCEDPRQRISLLPYQSVDQLRNAVIEHALVGCEHGLVFVPGPATDQQYLEDRQRLGGHEMQVAVNYLGFTMDEYNMMWNSVDTLKRCPRIFSVPVAKPGGRFVVCGSGPSLDDNLEALKQLPEGWTLIACASNYRTLRAAGIEVDILCLLERGAYEFDNYAAVCDEFGLGETRLLASITCDSRLHDLFADSIIYFRSALSPLSVFSSHPAQVLPFEGPQTVNTGVALCAALGANDVVLVGVDLGTASLEKVRSDRAVGESVRTFEQEVPGNFQDKAFTSALLLDGRLAMEHCIASAPSMRVFNASNGIRIEGAEPCPLHEVFAQSVSMQPVVSTATWQQWWEQRPSFEPEAQLQHWQASRPRAHVSATLQQVRQLMASNEPWFPVVQDQLHELLRLDVPIQAQVGRRLCRGVLLKLAITISRQCYVLLSQDPSGQLQQRFLPLARQQLVELCDQLEEEIYELFDQLEADLQATAQQR